MALLRSQSCHIKVQSERGAARLGSTSVSRLPSQCTSGVTKYVVVISCASHSVNPAFSVKTIDNKVVITLG